MDSASKKNGRTLSRKTKSAHFKIDPEHYRLIEQRAERCGVQVSFWIRSILIQAASRPAKAGYIHHIREPNGTMT